MMMGGGDDYFICDHGYVGGADETMEVTAMMVMIMVPRSRHLVRTGKAGPGWVSYLRMGAFYTNFSITTPQFHIFL